MRQIMDASYADGRNTMFSDAELEGMLKAADEAFFAQLTAQN